MADGLDLRSDEAITMSFVEGSAVAIGNGLLAYGLPLEDSGFVVSNSPTPEGTGNLIGADDADGVTPAGGFGSELIIQMEVVVG